MGPCYRGGDRVFLSSVPRLWGPAIGAGIACFFRRCQGCSLSPEVLGRCELPRFESEQAWSPCCAYNKILEGRPNGTLSFVILLEDEEIRIIKF